jgi:hypothetical protein
MNAKIEKNELVIRIPLQSPRPSASGKTMVVATTGGFKTTDAKIDGKPISISINATIK